MVSVDMIAMVTSEASDGMVVFRDTPMEEGSGMFFLTLLTSSSLCPHSLRHPCDLTHSYGGSIWSVLPHTTHFVIPVSSLTSSSLCSHTHDLSSHPSHRYP